MNDKLLYIYLYIIKYLIIYINNNILYLYNFTFLISKIKNNFIENMLINIGRTYIISCYIIIFDLNYFNLFFSLLSSLYISLNGFSLVVCNKILISVFVVTSSGFLPFLSHKNGFPPLFINNSTHLF